MDTGTHIVMGVALGGLATLDPAVQADPTLFNAVLIGTIAGSQAPDFDTVLKLKDNATYIRHHRGLTHSLPAVIMWGLLVSAIIFAFVPNVEYIHLWAWTFLAVIIHVLTDIFNAYGTQAYRPFTRRWVAYGFINTFDPYIFGLHIAGIIGWILGLGPGPMWLVIYTVIVLYYIKRYMEKREIVNKINEYYPDVVSVATSPTLRQNRWRAAITTTTHLHVASVENGHIEIIDTFERIPLPDTPAMNLAREDKNVKAFLSFSPVYRWMIKEYDHYTEVRFTDLRYQARGRYPFVAVVQMDKDGHITSAYTGWIYSEHKLQNKLDLSDSPV